MLALLADNDIGAIGADDLRAIVTDLYTAANTYLLLVPYQYSTSTSPATGKTNITWDASATELILSETASDGSAPPWSVIDDNQTNAFNLSNSDDSQVIQGTITGPSTDSGTYRSFPVTVTDVVGGGPANNAQLTLALGIFVELG